MSQKEQNLTSLQILAQQLTQSTFPDPNNPQTVEEFINKFEGILQAIHHITRDDFSPMLKTTMLRAQLRGEAAARFGWGSFAMNTGGYESLKEALRQEFPEGNGEGPGM